MTSNWNSNDFTTQTRNSRYRQGRGKNSGHKSISIHSDDIHHHLISNPKDKALYNAIYLPNIQDSAKDVNFNKVFILVSIIIAPCILFIPSVWTIGAIYTICICVNAYRTCLALVGILKQLKNHYHDESANSKPAKNPYVDNLTLKTQGEFQIKNHLDTWSEMNQYLHKEKFIVRNVFETSELEINCKDENQLNQGSNTLYGLNKSRKKKLDSDCDLPLYSLLIPVYDEANKMQELISALSLLVYPKNKLEIFIIVENDDIATRQSLDYLNIPKFIKVIYVPPSRPRTKPKAMNYALNFTKGEIIGIFDAEDIPDALQLQSVVRTLRELPEEYICVQCRLNFFNFEENIITDFMSIEYSILFDYILLGSDALNLPLLLGGTSNHFKADKLKQLGGWDSYNVTEDAELAIRIYKNGYKIKALDSLTLEEAPTRIMPFIKQRSRWIKGFLQTFICYFKYLRLRYFAVSHIVFIVVNLCLFPIYLLFGAILILLWPIMEHPFGWTHFMSFLMYHALASIAARGDIKRYKATYHLTDKKKSISINKLWVYVNRLVNIKYLIGAPIYYLLHAIAFILSIFDLLTQPYNWRKTSHGASKTKFRKL